MDTRFTRHEIIAKDYGTGDLEPVAHKYAVIVGDLEYTENRGGTASMPKAEAARKLIGLLRCQNLTTGQIS